LIEIYRGSDLLAMRLYEAPVPFLFCDAQHRSVVRTRWFSWTLVRSRSLKINAGDELHAGWDV